MAWSEWEFSGGVADRVDRFASRLEREGNRESRVAAEWRRLRRGRLTDSPRAEASAVSSTTGENEVETSCDAEELIEALLERVESRRGEVREGDVPRLAMKRIFRELGERLSEGGFARLCEAMSTWEDEEVLTAAFEMVVLKKLKERDEASLSTITAVSALAESKSQHIRKCLLQLIASCDRNFNDRELLEQTFARLQDSDKEAVVRGLIDREDFADGNWLLLQAVTPNATVKSFGDAVAFMMSKCEDYDESQSFAKCLLTVCRDSRSRRYRDILVHISEKNKTLLKRQALKHLSG